MKKLFISLTVLFVLVMSACSNSSTDKRTMQKVANQKQLHTNLKMVKSSGSCKSKTRCCIIIIRW